MTGRPPPPSPPPLGAITVLSALLEARTGQEIADYRSWRVDTALRPLLRERGLETLDQLVTQLLDGSDLNVADRIVDTLLNQETSFFREATVFEQVREVVAAAEANGVRPRIWSAACAAGQEPLSLAMLFADRAAEGGPPMPEIVASDVSERALARARGGRYSQFEIQRGLPIRSAMRWFETTVEGDWVARPELLRLVSFRRVNLVGDDWPVGQFDVILCRNVLLYLSPAMKTQVFDRLAAALRPGGQLVLGAGETVIGQTRLLEPSRTFRGFYEVKHGTERAAA